MRLIFLMFAALATGATCHLPQLRRPDTCAWANVSAEAEAECSVADLVLKVRELHAGGRLMVKTTNTSRRRRLLLRGSSGARPLAPDDPNSASDYEWRGDHPAREDDVMQYGSCMPRGDLTHPTRTHACTHTKTRRTRNALALRHSRVCALPRWQRQFACSARFGGTLLRS